MLESIAIALLPILVIIVAVGIPIIALIRFGSAIFSPKHRKLIGAHPYLNALLAVLALFFIFIDLMFITTFVNPVKQWKNLSYKQYTKACGDYVPKIAIPESSEHINMYVTYGIDVGHEFVQAKVRQEDVDLKKIVSDYNFGDLSDPVYITNAPYSKGAFSGIFGATNNPKWWIDEGDYDINELMFGCDGKYGKDQGYGHGCWVFYDRKTQTLNVFRWSQQGLSNDRFKDAFGIE
jgi:hypothetical protein